MIIPLLCINYEWKSNNVNVYVHAQQNDEIPIGWLTFVCFSDCFNAKREDKKKFLPICLL